MHLPAATIRTQVMLPLRFAGGPAHRAGRSHRRGSGADRGAATKAGRGAHTLDLACDDVLDAEAEGTDWRSTSELSSRPHQQILVVHGDRQVAGGCLGQASPCIRRSMGPQLGSLLACRGQPAGEPGGRESGVTGAEPPRARADQDFEAQPGEAVDRGADRVGTE